MLHLERKNLILKLVNERSAVSVADLTNVLDVSEVTIRKMLNTLARQGALRRTHGGAVSLSVPVREHDQKSKERTNTAQKRAIARAAYTLINPQDTVFLDAGSTTLELMRQIRDGSTRDITVVTNALNLAMELQETPDIALIVIGGELRHGMGSCIGSLAQTAIRSLCFDKAFIAANHISLEYGATTPNPSEGLLKLEAVNAATNAYLLCDSSKFSGASLTRVCPLARFTAVITDNELDPHMASALRELSIPLVLADM